MQKKIIPIKHLPFFTLLFTMLVFSRHSNASSFDDVYKNNCSIGRIDGSERSRKEFQLDLRNFFKDDNSNVSEDPYVVTVPEVGSELILYASRGRDSLGSDRYSLSSGDLKVYSQDSDFILTTSFRGGGLSGINGMVGYQNRRGESVSVEVRCGPLPHRRER